MVVQSEVKVFYDRKQTAVSLAIAMIRIYETDSCYNIPSSLGHPKLFNGVQWQ